MRILLGVVALWGVLQDGGATASETLRRLEGLLSSGLPEAEAGRRKAYVDRLGSAFLTAPPARKESILEALPGALEFHRQSVLLHQFSTAGVPNAEALQSPSVTLPSPLIQEGFDAQVELLRGRVARSLAGPEPKDVRPAVEGQIDRLCDAVDLSLKPLLPGPIGARLAKQESDSLRSSWKESLELPLNAFLDAPLSEPALESVLAGIRSVPDGRTPVTLEEEDLADPGRMSAAEAMLSAAREAAFRACALCYEDLAPQERRVRDWDERARAFVAAESVRLGLALHESGVRPTSARTKTQPRKGAPVSDVASSVDTARAPAPASASTAPESAMRSRWSVVLLVAAAAGLAWFLRRAFRGAGA